MSIKVDASRYIENLFGQEDPGLRAARQDSIKYGLPAIHIGAEEGRFLQILAAASRAERAVEFGTLGGYSGIWIARGLPVDGKLITVDINKSHAEVARLHFDRAGVGEKVEIVIGDGHRVMKSISHRGPFGFVFIDAEKTGYQKYFDWAVENAPPGGIICAHNAFRSGRVFEDKAEAEVDGIAAFNQAVARDERVISTIYPAGDGTLIAVKR